MLCYVMLYYKHIYIYMSTTSPTISASQVMADEAAAEPAKPAEPVEPAVAPAAAEPAAGARSQCCVRGRLAHETYETGGLFQI